MCRSVICSHCKTVYPSSSLLNAMSLQTPLQFSSPETISIITQKMPNQTSNQQKKCPTKK
ncbi:hypothetical protein Hanom_Chr09g00840901 [Helianthus anomalus]